MGTHRDVGTGSQRHSPVCVNTDRHTDTPRTLHPRTAQIHPNTQTHTPTPSSPHPLRVSPHTHNKHSGTPTHKGRCPRHGHSHLHEPCTLTTPLCQGVTHTGSVTHMRVSQIQCRAHTVPRGVTHPVSQCHTACVTLSVTHTQPSGASSTLPAKPFIAPGRHRAPESFTEPCRAVPSRNRAEPAAPSRTGPC